MAIEKDQEGKVLHHYQHITPDEVTHRIDMVRIGEGTEAKYKINYMTNRTVESHGLKQHQSDSFPGDDYAELSEANAKFLSYITPLLG